MKVEKRGMRGQFKTLLTFAGVVGGLVGSLWVLSWLVTPALRDQVPAYSPEQLKAAEINRDVHFDLTQNSSLHRHIRVKPSGESPILAEMVKAGELPPVERRMPDEPCVMQGVDGIGSYGGTWRRLAIAPSDIENVIANRLSGVAMVRWSPLGYPLEPQVAKAVEASPDNRIWTITLRKGMRWSDGEPFNADDILYWWKDEATHPTITGTPPVWMRNAGKFGRVEKVSDEVVRFVFDEPYATFRETLASVREPTECPQHYLRKYHPDPKIGDAELIKRDMAAYRMPSAAALYRYMRAAGNPDCPRLWPWVYRSFRSSPPQVYVRNPYYYVVDPQGNQLPYIDRLQFDVQDVKLLALGAANGAASMQDRHIRYQDYTELMSRRELAGTEIFHWYSATRSTYAINPNMNRHVDPNDPATAHKAVLLADRRFRQALSLAIDRQAIIDADYNGQGVPSQVAPGAESAMKHERVANAFIEYDPARANAMLDELGLLGRDSEGYRTFADGSRMSFNFDFTGFTGVGPAQFVVDDWGLVGVRAIPRERTRPLFYAEKDAEDFDFNVWTGESDYMPLLYPRYFVAVNLESFFAVGWGRWYMRGGMFDSPESRTGGIPVPKGSPMYESMQFYEQALHTADPVEQKRFMDRVLDIAAENTWSISIATPPPQLVVVKKDFKNVPRNALFGNVFATPSNAGLETYYFEKPKDSVAANAEVRRSLLQSTPRPARSAGKSTVGGTIMMLLWSTVALMLLMVALRHPFIGRRLALMVPTLAVISVVVFVIIQAPPGDFLSSRIIQLAQSGDQADLKQVEDLRNQFHSDDPLWKKYARWMGLNWFVTFDKKDTGLLQGNMGRSMETQEPVNDLVSDQIVFTVLLSFGTILFTWCAAIPIGIYSAVKQYSLTDYMLTLVGFVGMCVPAFLLALVMMTVSGISGIFSPEFAVMPNWSWPKIVDLLKHIWIPVVVLGVGGTAGMIRVMRANLLDELRKPYVTTAMAKGVRPTRLLLKYPVRLALNPFVSGIGHLFPQLISGGAIVSQVLALPTLGPQLLAALLTEDTYLAASLLMLLSLLGVIGTLVSDLLLLLLDPRIRLGGGSR